MEMNGHGMLFTVYIWLCYLQSSGRQRISNNARKVYLNVFQMKSCSGIMEIFLLGTEMIVKIIPGHPKKNNNNIFLKQEFIFCHPLGCSKILFQTLFSGTQNIYFTRICWSILHKTYLPDTEIPKYSSNIHFFVFHRTRKANKV